MRLKSRGLGRKELVMDFREYEVVREGDEIVVVGTIRDPVTWDFSIRICEDDIAGMTKLVASPSVLRLFLRALFRRGKRHHWSQERREHLAEGKRRSLAAKEKVAQRVAANRAESEGGKQSPEAGREPAAEAR